MSEEKEHMWLLFWSVIIAFVIIGIIVGISALIKPTFTPPLKLVYSEFLDRDTGAGSKNVMTGPISVHEYGDAEDWEYD